MTRAALRRVVAAVVLLPGIPFLIGGWTVTTVEHLPDYAVAGEPLTLTFTVRSHGVTPIPRLRPRLEARARALTVATSTTELGLTGRYSATIRLPQAGDWTLTIHPGSGLRETTLLPMSAINVGTRSPVSLSDAERGRRLFVAKGCVTCHVDVKVGPDLAGKRYAPEHLTRILATPERVFAERPGKPRMPNLNLKPPEIAALVAYVNSNNGVVAGQ